MMPWMFFLFGLVSMTGQIVLLREILVIFHGTEISIGIFYGMYLGGIGLGAGIGAWLTKRKENGFSGIFTISLVALGFSPILHVVLIRTLPFLLGAAPAELAPLRGILVAAPAGTLITAFLTGFLFPVGCKAVPEATDRFIARLYVFEALGGLAAGLLFTFVLVRLLSPVHIAAMTALITGVAAAAFAKRERLRFGLVCTAVLVAIGLMLVCPPGKWLSDWSIRVRWDHLHPGLRLLASEPTRFQQVEVAQLGSQYSLFGDGKIVSSFPDPYSADRLAALIMAQKPDAKRFLVVGGSIGSFVGSLLAYPVQRVDVIEPDPEALTVVARFLTPAEKRAMQDPRVRLIFSDGRFYLNRADRGQYDTIVCMVPDPVSSFWNRYYTLEFLQTVSRALADRGLFFTGVTSSENFWGSSVASYAGSVYHTLKQVFPSVMGTPGDRTLFFASPEKSVLSLDPDELKDRYRSSGSSAFDPAAFDGMLPRERTAFVQKELERSPVLINTDFAPVSSSLAMILWGKFSGNEGLEFLNTVRRGGLTSFLLPMLLFFAASAGFRVRWGQRHGAATRFQVMLAMGAMAAAAMGSEIILIYGYQSLFGHVFERIGLVAALFMVGLAVGAEVVRLLLPRTRFKERGIVAILLVFALFCGGLTRCVEAVAGCEPWFIEAVIYALVFMSGLLTGAGFPLIAARHLEIAANPGVSSGWTDAADHVGAAVGAALTGALLVPLLGMERACMVLAVALVVPAALMVLEWILGPAETWLAGLRPLARPSFPYVRSSWVLVSCVLTALAWNILIGPPGRSPTVTFPKETLKKLSGSDSFTHLEKPYPHYVGRSVDMPGSTVTLSTIPPAGDVRGYGGPINMILSVTETGIIKGLGLVESRETPSYVRDLEPWLARFQGRSILHPLTPDLDALTGATITCKAVKQILSKTGARIAGPLLGMVPPAAAPAPRTPLGDACADIRVWAVLAGIVLFPAAFHSRSQRLRTACLLYSLVTFGFLLNAPFTGLDMASLLKGEIPAPGTWWRNLLFVAAVGISILWGQAFCGFLCPFGALQEFLCVRKLKRRASFPVERAGRYVKFVVLAVLVILFLVTDETVWLQWSPLEHFFGWTMDSWVLGLSLVALVASVVYFRFWCRYLCPAGAFLALFNRIALLRKCAPKPIPGKCDLGVISVEDVDCIRCHRCLVNEAHESSARNACP
jgi:predicted membrane-bound spermidine synthase